MKRFSRDTAVRFRAVFTVDGADTDPTTITFYIKEPDGTETAYTYVNAEIFKEATGIYYKDVVLDAEGRWACRAVGTGACRAGDIEPVEVPKDAFS